MAAVVVGAVFVASDAAAGLQQSVAVAVTNANYSGYAYGTFASFRNNADANAYVTFSNYGGNNLMVGELGGKQFSCGFPSSLLGAFNQALLSRDYFYVTWDTTGTCTSLYLKNSSAYGSY